MHEINQDERKRYARHISLSHVGESGQLKLKKSSVLVIGAGGLGCPVLQYMVAAGIGRIGIIDHDKVEISNLQRQILFSVEDVGKFKAQTAAYKLKLQNPFVDFQVYNQSLDSSNALSVIKDYDLVIDGTDNFSSRYLINDACVILKKPLVFGSILQFEGQVSVFNYQNGPTYRCLYDEVPDDSPSCSEIGVLGVLPGIVGTLQANEAIKILLGIGDVLSGKLLIFDSLKMDFKILKFAANPSNFSISQLQHDEHNCELPESSSIKEMEVLELKNRLENAVDIQIIDVREKEEYQAFNIGGLNIPLGELLENYQKISRDKAVVIHCQKGGRSLQAIKLLQEKNHFTNLYNLSGGLEKWF